MENEQDLARRYSIAFLRGTKLIEIMTDQGAYSNYSPNASYT